VTGNCLILAYLVTDEMIVVNVVH